MNPYAYNPYVSSIMPPRSKRVRGPNGDVVEQAENPVRIRLRTLGICGLQGLGFINEVGGLSFEGVPMAEQVYGGSRIV